MNKLSRLKTSTSRAALHSYLNDHIGCFDALTQCTVKNIAKRIDSYEYKNLKELVAYIELMTGEVLESYITANGEKKMNKYENESPEKIAESIIESEDFFWSDYPSSHCLFNPTEKDFSAVRKALAKITDNLELIQG